MEKITVLEPSKAARQISLLISIDVLFLVPIQ
jgi:hypothetical protein